MFHCPVTSITQAASYRAKLEGTSCDLNNQWTVGPGVKASRMVFLTTRDIVKGKMINVRELLRFG